MKNDWILFEIPRQTNKGICHGMLPVKYGHLLLYANEHGFFGILNTIYNDVFPFTTRMCGFDKNEAKKAVIKQYLEHCHDIKNLCTELIQELEPEPKISIITDFCGKPSGKSLMLNNEDIREILENKYFEHFIPFTQPTLLAPNKTKTKDDTETIIQKPFDVGEIIAVKEAWQVYEASSSGHCVIKYQADRTTKKFNRIIELPTTPDDWLSPESLPDDAVRIYLEVKSCIIHERNGNFFHYIFVRKNKAAKSQQ